MGYDARTYKEDKSKTMTYREKKGITSSYRDLGRQKALPVHVQRGQKALLGYIGTRGDKRHYQYV